ncbi:MAG: pyruvate dehydrogenase complex dihydrolipoamide acetyltransferase [Rhodospirillaceae bacterium]|nr:pyruvate dehydrogenase complex dihydrolipoamide acetyltransferase [Rhodospirillaceae bacterium]
MPIEILMPALSPTMTEGTLARWMKAEGDQVSAGDVVAEIETDKATMEVEAVDEGTLGKILVEGGTENVAVNTPIALLLAEGEDASALEGAASKPAGKDKSEAEPATPEADAAPANATAEKPAKPEKPKSEKPKSEKPKSDGGRLFASPLARRMAEQEGLELSALSGSGPGGRIVKADIERALAEGTGKAKPAAAEAAAPAKGAAAAPAARAPAAGPDAKAVAEGAGIPFTEVANSSIRKVIARRLTESKQTVPHFYLTVDCALDRLLDVRKQLNTRGEAAGVKLSVNDLIIKAAAVALRQVPGANAAWTDSAILMFQRVDMSVAVATDNGLITPIIKDAANKGLSAISAEMKDLAARARDGKLKPEEFQGGTFTISNLGMFGIKEFGAIINPPQACILAVGAGEQRPVVVDGAVAVKTMMSATLSVDHRVVDGALGAQYLQAFKALVEDPLGLLL